MKVIYVLLVVGFALGLSACAQQTSATWKKGEWKTMPLAPPAPYAWPADPAPAGS